jgi:hypothetical protein
MTTDNYRSQDDNMNAGSQADAHSLIALEQSALYAARLAIARWISSSADPAMLVTAPDPAASRATWYAQAQQNFQEWLGRGGFTQYDLPCAAPAEASSSSALDSDAQPLAVALTLPVAACFKAPTCTN